MMSKPDKWEISNAVDTLKRAEEIKKNSGLMKSVKAEAKKQQIALSKIVRVPMKKGGSSKRR